MIQQTFTNNKPTLYLVATPIGNLDEMTFRSINILKQVSLIGCEDTRTSKVLLDHYEIKTPLLSYHKFNERSSYESFLKVLKEGKNIALISDAGYPLISDPGHVLVDEAIKEGFNVTTVSGSCAFLHALVSSNLDLTRFTFIGFLDSKEAAKKEQLIDLKNREETLIFYEAVHRIKETLELMKEVFGNRQITLARELTKKFEEFSRGTIQEVIDSINENTKGEFVIIVEGQKEKETISEKDLLKEINDLINKGEKSKEAITAIANKYSLKKNMLYDLYVKSK